MANDIQNIIFVTGNAAISQFEKELENRMSELIDSGIEIADADMASLLFFGKKADELDLEKETGSKWFWFSQDDPFTTQENVMTFRSAWGPCYKFSAYLVEKLAELDSEVIVNHEWYDLDNKANRGEAAFKFQNKKVQFKEGVCNESILEKEAGSFDRLLEDEDEYEMMLEDQEIEPTSKVVFVSTCEKIVRQSLEKSKFTDF